MKTMKVHVLMYTSLLCLPLFCLANNILKMNESLLDKKDHPLVSTNETFEMGFFSPPETSNRYLGIWYHNKQPQTLVWVANRDNPIPPSKTGIFKISPHGNLTISDTEGNLYWYHTPSQVVSSATRLTLKLKLMDNGNLILGDDQLQTTYWQSFDHPTDTFLMGMDMEKGLVLNSWRNHSDPGSGIYTFSYSLEDDSYTIYFNKNQVQWESEKPQDFGSMLWLLTNFTPTHNITFRNTNMPAIIPERSHFVNARLVMNSTGKIEFWRWDDEIEGWTSGWKRPENNCQIDNYCGNYGSCNTKRNQKCICLPGFSSKSPVDNHIPSSRYGGCFRKITTCGQNMTTFLDLKNVKVRRSPDKKVLAENEIECQSMCFTEDGCPNCTAYSYDASRNNTYKMKSEQCSIWTSHLPTIQEETDVGFNLSIPVNKRDIEPTPRTCKPCGVFTIPYPLSTESTCGDPIYSSFKCGATGQVSFIVGEESYRVTNIDSVKRLFYIQIIGSDDCDASNLGPRLEPLFRVNPPCSDDDEVKTLGISWLPPHEPPCNNSTDCEGWSHSSCNSTITGNGRCLCHKKYQWDGSNLSCTQGHPRKNSEVLILAMTFSSLIFLACIIISAYIWRRKVAFKQEEEHNQRKRESQHDSERYIKDFIDSAKLEENDNGGIEVPYFDFNSILLATDNFSDVNKLGSGGYGPVYKGKFLDGQDIAVKRLSSVSSQGLNEFKNEVVLISKLQHRNLVRLRGYCITGEEKILLYEYMPNKSLDTFLFDRTQRVILDWPMRFDIILGVARGMLYLHQDSRLRVIHRDLKTSNILLDEEMQPKISDFGLAKIFGGKEIEASTERVVGTYGYMAPEYALDGFFSIKSDVFSLGVVMLEIVSGKKNTGFFQSNKTASLLGYAWRLWAENNLLDLMDRSLAESCNANQFIKCAQVSLLCVQDEPGDRPTMYQVLIMLESEIASLPTPMQPTFYMPRGLSISTSSSSKPEGILPTDTSYQVGR